MSRYILRSVHDDGGAMIYYDYFSLYRHISSLGDS
jgi:hypothetical protein